MADCPDCSGDLEVEEASLEKGEILICPGCGSELEVAEARPLRLARLPDDDGGEEPDGGSERVLRSRPCS